MFSAIGGIEKFNRSFSRALIENAGRFQAPVQLVSLYDKSVHADKRYTEGAGFTGFGSNNFKALRWSFSNLDKARLLILGHINLGILALFARIFYPGLPVVLLGHGVEIWKPKKWWQKMSLKWYKEVWVVSEFTRSQVMQYIPGDKVKVLYNTLDPYFGQNGWPRQRLEQHLGFALKPPMLLTVARLQKSEKEKGYDKVLELLPRLLALYPRLTYVLAGPCHKDEASRLMTMAQRLNISPEHIRFTGMLPQEALTSLYSYIPIFVMPSGKEGFGIVYIEAAWCGSHVIATRQGGAVEALLEGELGSLIKPGSEDALFDALHAALKVADQEEEKIKRKQLVEQYFSFPVFLERQHELLKSFIG